METEDTNKTLKLGGTQEGQASSDSVNCDVAELSCVVDLGPGPGGVKRNGSPVEDNGDDSAGLKKLKQEDTRSKPAKVMNNDLILAKIADGVQSKELLKLREVCPLWNNIFIPPLKKKHRIIYLSLPRPKLGNIVEFMKVATSSHCVPFSKFDFDLESSEDTEEAERICFLQDFMPTLGSTITSLSLDMGRYVLSTSEDELRRIIFDITPQLMELHITMRDPDWDEDDDDDEDETTEQESKPRLLKRLPKLKRIKLDVQSDNDVDPAFTLFVFDIIQRANELEDFDFDSSCIGSDIRNPTLGGALQSAVPHLNKLEALTVRCLKVPDLQHLNQLAHPDVTNGLNLDSLTITCSHDDHQEPSETARLFCDFLTKQGPTLKKLSLTTYDYESEDPRDPRPVYQLPRMENLNHLCLTFHGIVPFNRIQYQGQAGSNSKLFAETYPQLKKFSFDIHRNRCRNSYNMSRYLHPGVEHLRLLLVSSDYASLFRYQPIFTNLTRLEMCLMGCMINDLHVDVKEFGKIWTTWPNLTSLFISWQGDNLDLDLDAWLSGVSRPELETLKHEINVMDLSKLTLDELSVKLDNFKTRPGISSLTQLQEITFIAQGKKRPKLTDIGGYFGLALATQHLQRALINGNGLNLVSEDCKAFIRKAFGLYSVISL